jgi:hypothetical protein
MITDIAREVCNDSSVGTRWRVAQSGGIQSLQGGCQPEKEQLQRNRRVDSLDRFCRVSDDYETFGGHSDEFLPGVSTSPSLDQPAVGSDLVCSVDCHVQVFDSGKRLHENPE